MENSARLDSELKEALKSYVSDKGEAALANAYELAREALARGHGVLELVEIQHRALLEILGERGASEKALEILRRAGSFFVESLSPFEMTHRGYQEANVALRRINDVLEEEARRIAHALHDDAGQLLAAAQITLSSRSETLPREARKDLAEIQGLLRQLDERLRGLSHEIRPPVLDDLGLVPALEFLSRGISQRSGLEIVVEGRLEQRLPPRAELVLYRVVQEALTNVLKHAGASRVTIRLAEKDTWVTCTVRDDGGGFDPSVNAAGGHGRGIGLLGMQERLRPLAGALGIRSAPGKGTELTIRLPTGEEPYGNSSPAR